MENGKNYFTFDRIYFKLQLTPEEISVVLYLNSLKHLKEIYPSYKRIQKNVKISVPKLSKTLKTLELSGIIGIKRDAVGLNFVKNYYEIKDISEKNLPLIQLNLNLARENISKKSKEKKLSTYPQVIHNPPCPTGERTPCLQGERDPCPTGEHSINIRNNINSINSSTPVVDNFSSKDTEKGKKEVSRTHVSKYKYYTHTRIFNNLRKFLKNLKTNKEVQK